MYKYKDPIMVERAEFMYNYLDYDNDRSAVRQRFTKNYNKKASLRDIGELLDKLVLDEKA